MAQSGDDRSVRKRTVAIATLAAVVLASLLIDPRELTRPLVLDERVTYWVISPTSPGTFWQRATVYSATPPGYMALVRLLGPTLSVLPDAPWGMRLVSVFCYIWLGGALAAWLVRRAGVLPAAIGTALVLAHPLVLEQAHLARPYVVGTLAAWYAMTWTAELVAGRARRPVVVGWLVANFFVLWSHYLFGLLWAVQSALLLHAVLRGRLRFVHVLGLHVALVLIAVPLLPGLMWLWVKRQYLNWSVVPARWSALAELVGGAALASWRFPSWWAKAPAAVVALAIGVGVLLGVADRRRAAKRAAAASAFGWSAAGLLPVLALWLAGHAGMPSLATPRYAVPFLVVLLGGLAAGAGVLLPRAWQVLLLIGLLTVQPSVQRYGRSLPARLLAELAGLQPKNVLYEPVGAAWDEATRYVMGHARDGDYLLVSSGLAEMSLLMVFAEDALLQDYVACRVMRLPGQRVRCHRLGVPLQWTPAVSGYYERRFRGAVAAWRQSGARPERYPRILFVAATDTDRLRRLAAITDELIRRWGWHPVDAWQGTGVKATVYAAASGLR